MFVAERTKYLHASLYVLFEGSPFTVKADKIRIPVHSTKTTLIHIVRTKEFLGTKMIIIL
jgi:hypothetical protein